RPPSFLQEPSSVTVVQGQSATFNASASGTAPLNYQWQFNGQNIANATGTSYSLTNVQVANVGNYRIKVSNSSGTNTSSNAVLTVLGPPVVTVQPTNV